MSANYDATRFLISPGGKLYPDFSRGLWDEEFWHLYGLNRDEQDAKIRADADANLAALGSRISAPDESTMYAPGEENRLILSRMNGWVAGPTTNATFNLNDTSEAALDTNSVSITTNGTGATSLIDLTGIPPFSMDRRGLVFWLKATNIESIKSVYIKVSSTNTFSAAFGAGLPIQAGNKSPLKDGELFPVYVPPGNLYVNNGSPDVAALTAIRVHLLDMAGMSSPTLTIAGVASFVDKHPPLSPRCRLHYFR